MPETVFIVDDDEQILKACQRLLKDESYHCQTFVSPEKALEKAVIIKPAVVVSDQKMCNMEGTVFLEKIRRKLPYAVRLIMTGYADIDVTIAAINQGHVYRFIKKPWDDLQFKSEIMLAIKYSHLLKLRRKVLKNHKGKKIVNQERFQGVLEMAGAVCHEFSQPLQVISGYCGLLNDMPDTEQDDKIRNKYMTQINNEVDKLGDLLLKIMAINGYKTMPYAAGHQIVDIHGSSFDKKILKGIL